MALDSKLKRIESFDGKDFEMMFPTCYFSSVVKEKNENGVEKALIYRGDQVETITTTERQDGVVENLIRTIYQYEDLFADAEKIDESLLTEDKITGTKEDKYYYVSEDSDKLSKIESYKDDVLFQEIDFEYTEDGNTIQNIYSIDDGEKYIVYNKVSDEGGNELESTQYTYLEGDNTKYVLKHMEIDQSSPTEYVYKMEMYDKINKDSKDTFELIYRGTAVYAKDGEELKDIQSFPLLSSFEEYPTENRTVKVVVDYDDNGNPITYHTKSIMVFDDIGKESVHEITDKCFYNEDSKLDHIESEGKTISTVKYFDKYREITEINVADDDVNETHEVIYRFDNDNEEIYEKYIPAINRYEYNLPNAIIKSMDGKVEGCRITLDGTTYETFFKVDTYLSSMETRDEFDVTVYSKKIRALSNQVHNYIIHKVKDNIDFKIGDSMFKKYM